MAARQGAPVSFHDDCLVVDGHTDLPTRLWESPADLGAVQRDRHLDLPRLRQGGVDALVCAYYVPAALDAERGWQHALALDEALRGQLVPGLRRTASTAEIRHAVARGEVAVIPALENGRPLLVPGALEQLGSMGVRYVTLTHFKSHEWCDASTDEPHHGGLSSDGVERVRAMNRLGILADVSHVSDAAVLQVLEVALIAPVASHSSCRSLCDHPRNLPDELVREIARRGGVVMANSYPAFLDPRAAAADAERSRQLGPELEASEEAYLRDPGAHWRARADLLSSHRLPAVGVSVYVDHVIHLIDLAGEEHVGIGTDFDGIPDTLVGFEDASCFPGLTDALLDRGVDRAGLRLVLGENFLRLLASAERLAG